MGGAFDTGTGAAMQPEEATAGNGDLRCWRKCWDEELFSGGSGEESRAPSPTTRFDSAASGQAKELGAIPVHKNRRGFA